MKRRTFYPTNKERPIFKWTLDDGGPLLAHYKDGRVLLSDYSPEEMAAHVASGYATESTTD
jgi:hypothetical protein